MVREDGTQSWQHQQTGIATHDLTHYAVETTLELKNGFYGLLAQGWDIIRLTDRDVRSILPPEGLWTELVVGLIQTERLSPEPLSAADFNDMLDRERQNFRLGIERQVSDDELNQIRDTFNQLYFRWRNLKPGEQMSLEFG